MIIAPTRFDQLINKDGTPTLRLSLWLEETTRAININTPIQGTGSPEGIITAEVGQRYMDTNGVSEAVLYIKQTGAGNTGWMLG